MKKKKNNEKCDKNSNEENRNIIKWRRSRKY